MYSLLTIIGVWILSIGIVSPVANTGVHTDYCYCAINNSDFFSIWSSLMAFLIPLSLIIFRQRDICLHKQKMHFLEYLISGHNGKLIFMWLSEKDNSILLKAFSIISMLNMLME